MDATQKVQSMESAAGGNMTEAMLGVAVVVLSILALVNVLPMILLAIAIIAAGAGMLFQGSALNAEYSHLMSMHETGNLDSLNLKKGTSTEVVTGCAGIILGILTLIGLVSNILAAVAAIVVGCGLAFSGKSISRLNKIKIQHSGADDNAQALAHEAVSGASSAHVLIGIGAAVLGILAIIGVAPTTLTMIAFIAIGGVSLFSGLAVTGETMMLG